jgi:membrane-associated protease RseP (regulator of RpoE activity)
MNKLASALLLCAAPAFADTEPGKPTPVKFELVPSGHFIVKVKLNGKGPYNLIFDTGAPSTLISPRIAKDAGLTKDIKDKPPIALFGMMGSVQVKEFQVGDVKAENVSAMILDHPTVKLFSDEYEPKYGKIEGIVGFPFFAHFRMTVDYAAKEMTFAPSGYKAGDAMQDLMKTMMEKMMGKPEPRVAAPAALWGLELAKSSGDEADGVDVKMVASGGAAAEAGLKAGDRILTIDGRWTDNLGDAYTAASFAKPGRTVVVTARRDGKEIKVTVSPKLGL